MLENHRFSTFYQRQVLISLIFLLEKKNSNCYIQDLGKAANFPYATINPEEARIPVPDTRFEWLCDVYKPVSRVPAFLTCIDIAGLTAVRLSSLVSRNQSVYLVRRVLQLAQVSETPSYLMFVLSMEFFKSFVPLMTQKSSM
jgi:hypothetical protein